MVKNHCQKSIASSEREPLCNAIQVYIIFPKLLEIWEVSGSGTCTQRRRQIDFQAQKGQLSSPHLPRATNQASLTILYCPLKMAEPEALFLRTLSSFPWKKMFPRTVCGFLTGYWIHHVCNGYKCVCRFTAEGALMKLDLLKVDGNMSHEDHQETLTNISCTREVAVSPNLTSQMTPKELMLVSRRQPCAWSLSAISRGVMREQN